MKKRMIIGILLVSLCMVSYATAIPYSESKPIVNKIKQIENFREKLGTTQFSNPFIGLVCTILGSAFLVPTYIFLIIGLICLDMGGTFAMAAFVFSLFGLFSGIISFILLSIGLSSCSELQNLLSISLIFIIPLIITFLLFFLVLGH